MSDVSPTVFYSFYCGEYSRGRPSAARVLVKGDPTACKLVVSIVGGLVHLATSWDNVTGKVLAALKYAGSEARFIAHSLTSSLPVRLDAKVTNVPPGPWHGFLV